MQNFSSDEDRAVIIMPDREVTVAGKKPQMCEVCKALLNLWLTGEWRCPACGGPDADTAAILNRDYVMYG
ncbi:MAG TPA: hypothetical protein VMY37_18105 [Thermoguttaceae bacterium]|nr:hypothetical protein [Thermoguttaceae bacterium]